MIRVGVFSQVVAAERLPVNHFYSDVSLWFKVQLLRFSSASPMALAPALLRRSEEPSL